MLKKLLSLCAVLCLVTNYSSQAQAACVKITPLQGAEKGVPYLIWADYSKIKNKTFENQKLFRLKEIREVKEGQLKEDSASDYYYRVGNKLYKDKSKEQFGSIVSEPAISIESCKGKAS